MRAVPTSPAVPGQTTMAESTSVTLASDQILPLPTNAATAANQTAANTSLATIATAQGVAGTGITQPTGGTGLMGLLSGIYKAISNTLSISQLLGGSPVSNANPLPVSVVGGGGGGNPAASATGVAVPTDADYMGFNSGGELVGVSTANPLPVSGTVAVAGTLPVSGTFYQTTQPVSVAAVPLAPGAAIAANQYNPTLNADGGAPVHLANTTPIATSLTIGGAAIATTNPMPVQSEPAVGRLAINVGQTVASGRSFCAICSVAGNVSVTFANGSTGVYPLLAGVLNIFPFAVVEVNSAGTTATATYENWV